MEIKKIKYPYHYEDYNAWYKFGDSEGAVHIRDSEVEEWVNSAIQSVKTQLENGIDHPYSFQASGDTIVWCFFSQDVEENVFDDDNYFVVIVARNYEEGNFFVKDIKENNNNENEIEEIKKEIQKLNEKLERIGG